MRANYQRNGIGSSFKRGPRRDVTLALLLKLLLMAALFAVLSRVAVRPADSAAATAAAVAGISSAPGAIAR